MISNCGHDENNRYSGGKSGDQTGGEWNIIPWYDRPWNVALRHPDRLVREEIAVLAERAARNNLIGYDQNQRHTFWQHLKASNYDPAQITIACEADCSSGVLAIAKAVGYRLGIPALQSINQDGYTKTERDILVKAGFTALTDSKYRTTDAYLLRGDILLYEGHHTATNLTNGSKSGAQNTPSDTPSAPNSGSVGSGGNSNVREGQAWLNDYYGALLDKYAGGQLKEDGDYGTQSRKAALTVWKDVVSRKYGHSLTLGNYNFYDTCKKAAPNIRRGDDGTLVYIAKLILSAKGAYSGAMNTLFDMVFESAVKAYQRAHGLSADGVIGANTWYTMFN